MPAGAPWRDREQLRRWLAWWRTRAAGSGVHGVAAGEGWVSIQLAGADRASLLLGALPGAVLLFPYRAPLPAALRAALPAAPRHPLSALLREAKLDAVALLAADLALQLSFATPAGTRQLRHQLFGSRGGSTLLAADGRLLWTAHPSPHPCLLDLAAALEDTAGRAVAAAAAGAPAPVGPQDEETWSLYGQQRLARHLEVAVGDRLLRALERRRGAAERLLANLQVDLDRADTGEQLRQDAECLAANLHTVPRGAAEVVCRSPLDGSPRTIRLDAAASPAANLDRLFKLAGKAQRSRRIVEQRQADARADHAALQAAGRDLAPLLAAAGPLVPPTAEREALAAARDLRLVRLAELLDFAARHPDALPAPPAGAGARAPEEPVRPYRRYVIDGRWEVWIGRNARENDELTHRASHPRDLWLHAQGVEGSHVVLRTGGRPETVPRAVRERAAALAALFSKARHSSLVPVLWTERRYVRRPRRAAPGTAVCLRAESVFVAPGVAAGVEPA